VATTLHPAKGGQFRPACEAMPGNPYDGHTLGVALPETEKHIGATIKRVVADRGYRGHNAPQSRKFRVFISGQRQRVTEQIIRELRRRSAVEPVIGHLKAEHRMGHDFLDHTIGDAINAVIAAAGYNFRRVLAWLAFLCALLLAPLGRAQGAKNHPAAA
jgi:IS5 family transposase